MLILDEDSRHLRHGAAPNLPEAYNTAIGGIGIGEGEGSRGTVASRDTPVYAADIANDPLWVDFRDLALENGLGACWSTPIQGTNGGLLGTFAISYDQPHNPTPADIDVIATIAQTAALAIERHRSDLALERSRDDLRAPYASLEMRVAERSRARDRIWQRRPDLQGVLNPEGYFEAANPAWQAVLGWSNKDIIRSSAAPICAFDTDCRLIAFNQAHSDEFVRILACRVQIGDRFPDLFSPEQATVIQGFMARALTGESFTVTEEFGDPALAKPCWEVTC